MKSFPSGFTAEKDKKAGLRPVWILRLTVGGVAYYLSDAAFQVPGWIGGVSALPWVASWGQVQEGIDGQLGEIRVSDFTMTLLADPDASPNMIDLAEASDLEREPASLYLWFRDLDAATDPPQEILRGYVRDVEIPDETRVELVIEDESARLQQYIGTRITREAYPEADSVDVGQMIPIPFGTVRRLRGLAVESGARTSLPANINESATSLAVTDAAGLSPGDTVQIDTEEMTVSDVSGNTITVARGQNLTVATSHLKGAVVWEKKASHAYLLSNVPVDSLPKVYGTISGIEVDITSIATRYTGRPGSEHPSYPGMAVVTTPGYITVEQAVNLLLDDGIDVEDALAVVDNIDVQDNIGVDEGSHTHPVTAYPVTTVTLDDTGDAVITNVANMIDGAFTTGAYWVNMSPKLWRRRPVEVPGAATRVRVGVRSGSGATDMTGTATLRFFLTTTISPSASMTIGGSATNTKYTPWLNLSGGAADLSHGSTFVEIAKGSAPNVLVYEVWYEVEYDPTPEIAPASGVTKTGLASKTGEADRSGQVSKTGTVTLAGSQVAFTQVGDTVLADVVRSVSAPADVCAEILSRCPGMPSACSLVGTLPAGYAFNGAITEYRRAIDWLDELAFQARSYFRLSRGEARLIVRPDALAPGKIIPACRLRDGRKVLSRRKAPISEIINRVNILYDRDWSQPSGLDTSYRALSAGSDAQSIADYGEHERPELFRFDFVTSQTMADNLRAFYLAQYARRYWQIEMEVFLDHCELEFADPVTLQFLDSLAAEIQSAGFSPGDIKNMDVLRIRLRGAG